MADVPVMRKSRWMINSIRFVQWWPPQGRDMTTLEERSFLLKWSAKWRTHENSSFTIPNKWSPATATGRTRCYRRWTKYSNLEERIGRHPLPQMSKLKNVCVICHAVGFDLFCPPVSTLGRRKQLWNLGGAGDKVVQGLNNLSIYCMCTYAIYVYLCSVVYLNMESRREIWKDTNQSKDLTMTDLIPHFPLSVLVWYDMMKQSHSSQSFGRQLEMSSESGWTTWRNPIADLIRKTLIYSRTS